MLIQAPKGKFRKYVLCGCGSRANDETDFIDVPIKNNYSDGGTHESHNESFSDPVDYDETDYVIVPYKETYIGSKNILKQRHGNGMYLYENGDLYDGEWKNNMKHGYGQYRFQSGIL